MLKKDDQMIKKLSSHEKVIKGEAIHVTGLGGPYLVRRRGYYIY
jgi:hypothetical protein